MSHPHGKLEAGATSLSENLEERLNLALDRIETLESEVLRNRRRIKNSRAACALVVALVPVFLVTGEVHFGEKVSGEVRSRELSAGEVLSAIGICGSALGVVSLDELVKLSKLLRIR